MDLRSYLLIPWLVLVWVSSAAAGIDFQGPAAPGTWTYLQAPLQLWISDGTDVLLDAPGGELQYRGARGWEPLTGVGLTGKGTWKPLELRWYIPWELPGPISEAITLKTPGQVAVLTGDNEDNRFLLVNSSTHFALETDALAAWQWVRLQEQERLLFQGEPIWPAPHRKAAAEVSSSTSSGDPWRWSLPAAQLQPGEVVSVALPFAEAENDRWCQLHVGGGWELVSHWTYDGSVVKAADDGLQIPSHGGTLKGYLQAIPHPEGHTGWIEAHCSGRSARGKVFIDQSWLQEGIGRGSGPGQFTWTPAGWTWTEPLARPPASGAKRVPSAVWYNGGFRFGGGSHPMELQLTSTDAAAQLIHEAGTMEFTWDGHPEIQWSSRSRRERRQSTAWLFQSYGDYWRGRWLTEQGSRWTMEGSLEENPLAAVQWTHGNFRWRWQPLHRQWVFSGVTGQHSWSLGRQPDAFRLQWLMAGPLQWDMVRGTKSDRVRLRLGDSSHGAEAAWERRENAQGQWSLRLFSVRSELTLQLEEKGSQWSIQTHGSLAGGTVSAHWTGSRGEFGPLQFARLRWEGQAGPIRLRAGPDIAAAGDRVYVDWLAGLQIDLTPSTSLYLESHTRRGSLWRLGVAVPGGRNH